MKEKTKKKILIYIGIALLVLFSPFWTAGIFSGLFDSSFHKLRGTDYSVGWVNLEVTTTLYYKIDRGTYLGVLEPRVIEVSWDDQYILATRLRNRDDSIDYHIVKMLPPVEKGVPWKKFGPFRREEFEAEKRERAIDTTTMRHKKFE